MISSLYFLAGYFVGSLVTALAVFTSKDLSPPIKEAVQKLRKKENKATIIELKSARDLFKEMLKNENEEI